MIRQALNTSPNRLPSSSTPTLVLITLSAVVFSLASFLQLFADFGLRGLYHDCQIKL